LFFYRFSCVKKLSLDPMHCTKVVFSIMLEITDVMKWGWIMDKKPVLYSYRRCPYAMRARMALAQARIDCSVEDISLKDKPKAFLDVAPKGCVPVLYFADGTIIDESLDIMLYALNQNDPDHWLPLSDRMDETLALIAQNDGAFKKALDVCKYAIRHTQDAYDEAKMYLEKTLIDWNHLIAKQGYFHGAHLGLADIALLPFIRQAMMIEPDVTAHLAIEPLRQWADARIQSDIFQLIMAKSQS
jgi:glutathione S-transferase